MPFSSTFLAGKTASSACSACLRTIMAAIRQTRHDHSAAFSVFELMTEHGVECYVVQSDDQEPPAIEGRSVTILLWVAPLECWPADVVSPVGTVNGKECPKS